MPFSYVPSIRVLRTAWTLVAVIFAAVVVGLVYATIATATDLAQTNSRLDRSEVQRQALIRRLHSHGFALTFINERGSHEYVCKLTKGNDGYTCQKIS